MSNETTTVKEPQEAFKLSVKIHRFKESGKWYDTFEVSVKEDDSPYSFSNRIREKFDKEEKNLNWSWVYADEQSLAYPMMWK